MTTNPSLTSFVNQIIAAQQQQLSGHKPTRLTGDPNKFNGAAVASAAGNDSPGLGSRIIDLISRPLYASAGVAKELVATAQGENNNKGGLLSSGGVVSTAAGKGILGQEKNTYRDVVNQIDPDAPDWVKGTVGLAGDIVLDPLNLIPGAAIGAVVKAPFRAARFTSDVIKGTGPAARAAEKVAKDNALWSETRLAQDTAASNAAETAGRHDAANLDEPVVLNPERDTVGAHSPENVETATANYGRHAPVETPVGQGYKATADAAFKQAFGDQVNPLSDAARIAESNNKIADAAVLANAHAPETVKPLDIPNIPKPKPSEAVSLGIAGQGKLGTDLQTKALLLLKDPATGRDLYKPGVERAQVLRAAVLPEWKASVERVAATGEKPFIQSSDGTVYNISLPHALEALPEKLTNDIMFGASFPRHLRNANLYPSQIAKGMAESLRADDLGLPLVERLNNVYKAMVAAKPSVRNARSIPKSQLDDTARELVGHVQILRDSQYETAKTLIHKDLEDAATITHHQSQKILDNLHDPAVPLSHSVADLAAVGPNVVRDAKAIGASDNAASIAGSETAKLVGKVAPEADTSAARTAGAVKRERIAGSSDHKIVVRVQNHLRTVEKEIDEGLGVPIVDLGVKADMHINGMMASLMHGIRSKFTYGYGMGPMADVSREFVDRGLKETADYRLHLNKLAKAHTKPALEAGFSAFKRGEAPVETAALAAYNDMAGAVNFLFDTSDPLMGSLWRTGAGLEEINKALAKGGIRFSFDDAKAGTEYLRQEKKVEKATLLADQWRDWDITDPLDFLARTHGALTQVAAKQATGTFFAHQFGKLHPGPGLVKFSVPPNSILGNFVDTSKFYSRDAAQYMTHLESMLHEATNFRGEKGAVAGFVNHLLDPVMQLWKPFMTIFRPGHHVRNLMGDTAISALDGVYSVGHYRKALSMMHAGGALQKEGIEGLEKINAGALADARNGADKMSTVRLRGKNVPMSYDSGYKLAHRYGLLQSFHQTEDILEATNRVTDKVMGTAWMRGMGLIAEKTGQFTRLAHFNALMERKSFTRQFSSIEDAAQAASARVKRYHPDVKGLTPFEQKYMRRIFPFYSWIRQAFPIVFNTLATKPARVNLIPKAQYNAAVAMGVDPNTLSDPFPTNSIYPSFIQSRLSGPLVDQLGFNFGTPTEGVLGDTLNGSPWRNIAAQVNPIFKTPLEVSTQTNIQSGAPIQDIGETIDQVIPLVNQASTISGYSATGTLGNLFSGLMQLDPQRSVARGEKAHFFNESLTNFLSGLGVQTLNKDSYQNIARKENGGG